MAWAEDLSPFIDTASFAVTATIAGQPVNGIFDNASVLSEGYDGVMETVRPVFVCRSADVAAVLHGDSATINSVSYKVRGTRPDGTGMTLIILEAQ